MKVETRHSCANYFDGKVRHRDHESMAARLSKLGQDLSAFVGNTKCLKMSERMYSVQQQITFRSELMRLRREEPTSILTVAESNGWQQMLRGFDPSQLSVMLSSVCFSILQGDREHWHQALTIASLRPEPVFTCACLQEASQHWEHGNID